MTSDTRRRPVAVLFCDMVGFTALSDALGEDATYSLMREVSARIAEIVAREGGLVCAFSGDGVMAIFDTPVSLEDAAVRACRAALAIADKLDQVPLPPEAGPRARVRMRMAIHVGPAVIGAVAGTHGQPTAVGDTVNLAARLQAFAPEGGTVLSQACHHAIGGLVASTPLGEVMVKGKAQPQSLHHLTALKSDAPRFAAARHRGLSPFVGRGHELALLRQAALDLAPRLQVIEIAGEAGAGKSRLLHEFRSGLAERRPLSGASSPQGRMSPFAPFIGILREALALSATAGQSEIAAAVTRQVAANGLGAEIVPGLLRVLGVIAPGPIADNDTPQPAAQRAHESAAPREAIVQFLKAEAARAPLLLVLEDTHWIDSASEDVLTRLAQVCASLPLLIVTTRRLEGRALFAGVPGIVTLPLAPLPRAELAQLAAARLGAVPDALVALLAEKSEGNALFAEEILNFLIERKAVTRDAGQGAVLHGDAPAGVPASIESVVLGRVDQLPAEEKRLLLAASVLGRRFPGAVALRMLDLPARDLDRFEDLAAKGLLQREREGPPGSFAFKHILVRDSLYDSLLMEQKRVLHLAAGEEIARSGAGRADLAETLAYHFRHTDRRDLALSYALLAGERALQVYSLDEAEAHLSQALALAEADGADAPGPLLGRLIAAAARTLSLKQKLREVIALADRWLDRLLAHGPDRALLVILHHCVVARVWLGEPAAARAAQARLAEIARGFADPAAIAYAASGEILLAAVLSAPLTAAQGDRRRAALAAADATGDSYLETWVRFVLAWDAMHRGAIGEARGHGEDLMRAGERLGDSRALGLGLWLLGRIGIVCGEAEEALGHAEASIRAARTPFDRGTGQQLKAIALILLGRVAEGMALLATFRDTCRAQGWNYHLYGSDMIWGLGQVLQGRIGAGLSFIHAAIRAREREGYRTIADWGRMLLATLYLRLLEPGAADRPVRPRLADLPRLGFLRLMAGRRIGRLTAAALANPALEPDGLHAARLHLLAGQGALARGRTDAARTALQLALDAARRQGAEATVREALRHLGRL